MPYVAPHVWKRDASPKDPVQVETAPGVDEEGAWKDKILIPTLRDSDFDPS